MNLSIANTRFFRSTLLRVIGISVGLAFAGMAMADPPKRVARMGYVNGLVSFSPAGENDWVAGRLNRPIITGDRLWIDRGGRVELQIGSAVVRLDARTSFALTNLDDRIAQMSLQDGTMNLRVRRLDRGQVVEVDTPNLAFVIRQPGDYRIIVNSDQDSTEVRTRSGRADVYGGGNARSYVVNKDAAYRFFGARLDDYDVLALARADEFDRWSQARDRSYDTSVSARYVSRDVIGYQDLDEYGSWRNVPEFGNVWTPTRVDANWAPYRDGHWSWVEPWGWTWVDDQPWGFTVSHYGRWANAGGRWSWIPGPVASRAVYAPALVGFIGGSNFQVSASSGNVGAVGWFPLGPRDVYRPAYTVSREYFSSVNTSNTVINNTTIVNYYDNRNTTNVTNVTYVNRSVPGAVVTVPTASFVQSQPVARSAIRVTEAAIANAPVTAIAAVAPVQTSVLGAAPVSARPPQAREQRFVAQSAPPAAAVGFAVRERTLAANPGKPVDAAALASMRPATVAPQPAAANTGARGPSGAAAAQGAPATPAAPPRPEVVPVAPTAGPAVTAPPPRAPSDRRGGEKPPTREGAPSPQPAPAQPPAGQSGRPAMPPTPVTQEPVKALDRPSRPAAPPQPAPAAAPATAAPVPPPRAQVPAEVPRPAQPEPRTRSVAPPPAQDAPKPADKPSERPGRPVTTPPAEQQQPQRAPAARPAEVQPPNPAGPDVRVRPAQPAPAAAPPAERAPVQPPRARPAPAAEESRPPASKPAEVPPKAAEPNNPRTRAAEDKKDEKRGERKDERPDREEEEKKRK